MSSVRELLESAAPIEAAPYADAPEIRALAGRRQRRGRLVGAGLAVASVAAVAVVGVRVLAPATPPATPAVSTSPSPTAATSGEDLRALVGTRWVPDMVMTGVATAQAYPDEKGDLPRALITFAAEHRLTLDYIENGVTTTVAGTWRATSPSAGLAAGTNGVLRLFVDAPPGAPETLTRLVNRMTLVASYLLVSSDGPPRSLTSTTMFGYSSSANSNVMTLDLVKPSAVLPTPYPHRP